MNFASALFALQRGHKVKRKHWSGYWKMEDNEVFIHTHDGQEFNLRKTDDMFYTLSNIASNDWEIVEDWK